MSDRDHRHPLSRSPQFRRSSRSITPPSCCYTEFVDQRARQYTKRQRRKELGAFDGVTSRRPRSRSRQGAYREDDRDEYPRGRPRRDYRDGRSRSPRGRIRPSGYYQDEPIRGQIREDDRHRDIRHESPRGRARVRQHNYYRRQRREEELELERERCYQAHVRNAREMKAERERINRIFERRIDERRHDEEDLEDDRRREERERVRREEEARQFREQLEVNSRESYGSMSAEDYWGSIHLRKDRFPGSDGRRLKTPRTARHPDTPLKVWEHPEGEMCDFDLFESGTNGLPYPGGLPYLYDLRSAAPNQTRAKAPLRRDSSRRRSISNGSQHSFRRRRSSLPRVSRNISRGCGRDQEVRGRFDRSDGSSSSPSTTPERIRDLTPEGYAIHSYSLNRKARGEQMPKGSRRPIRILSRSRSPSSPRVNRPLTGYRATREKEDNKRLHGSDKLLKNRRRRSPTPEANSNKAVVGIQGNETGNRFGNSRYVSRRRDASRVPQASSNEALVGVPGKDGASKRLSQFDCLNDARVILAEEARIRNRYSNNRYNSSRRSRSPPKSLGQIIAEQRTQEKEAKDRAAAALDKAPRKTGSPSGPNINRLLDEYADLVRKNKELNMNASKGRPKSPARPPRSLSVARVQARGEFYPGGTFDELLGEARKAIQGPDKGKVNASKK